MSALLMRKMIGGRLEPVDEAGRDVLARVAPGTVLRVEMKRPRNLGHHRKFWALISLIYQNQTHYKSPEALCDVVKVLAGYAVVTRGKGGREIHIPKSISFSAMDQTEFDQFWDRVVKVVCEQIIPGLSRADLERELLDLVA